ncbi:MAG: hypothetical protein H7A21_00885 [Spirochaetales bacterium]|nr:hypothetical protein [Spirochaetales bacterium]
MPAHRRTGGVCDGVQDQNGGDGRGDVFAHGQHFQGAVPEAWIGPGRFEGTGAGRIEDGLVERTIG